ncbi:hypothetical protein [Streptomyces fractus]|uniref:hypothetical protein n=1 Tax=Streptomyces fractus TaxID=641806 RepID=UPI003CF56AF1
MSTEQDPVVEPDNTHVTGGEDGEEIQPLNTHVTSKPAAVDADAGEVEPDNTHVTSEPS